jgi:hypothetical protein
VDSAALAKAALGEKIDANIAANPDFVPFAADSRDWMKAKARSSASWPASRPAKS